MSEPTNKSDELKELAAEATQTEEYKHIESLLNKIIESWDTFQKTLTPTLQELLDALGQDIPYTSQIDIKGMEFQTWLQFVASAAQERALFAIVGRLGAEKKNGDSKPPEGKQLSLKLDDEDND